MFKVLKIVTHKEPEFDLNAAFGNIGKRKARYYSVMRALKPNTVYEFYHQSQNLPENFFYNASPRISISAIVGQNGMGKSSLIELMIRILNNAAYALRSHDENIKSEHPRFVRDVYATMFFEDDEEDDRHIHKIVVDDTIIQFKTDNRLIWKFDFECRNQNYGLDFHQADLNAKECMKRLFYTIVVNYSMYSYNTADYYEEYTERRELDPDDKPDEMTSEDYCWLNSIFHKNDGYQYPLVLNPFRDEGIIDVNNERTLTQNRVFLMTTGEDSPINEVLQGKEPYSYRFDIETKYDSSGQLKYGSQQVRYQMQYLRLLSDWKEDNPAIDILGGEIIKIWSHCLGYDLEAKVEYDDKQFDERDRLRALNYVVYKTIKISLTYGKYSFFQNALRNIDLTDKDDKNLLEVYVKLLHDDNTHITLKLFRALAFLLFGHYGTTIRHLQQEREVGKNELYLKDFDRRIDSCLRGGFRFLNSNQTLPEVKRYSDLENRHTWKKEELLPASCFDTRMWLKVDKEGNDVQYISLSSLSSGERQMIHMLCTAMYHLFNLKTNWQNANVKDESVKYRNVNIVFDEMELYFHPKFQTVLIERLLKGIKSMRLENYFRGINIMFSTHSPFILSDIPIQNILGMYEGSPTKLRNINNTFCANVYYILASGFFMKRFVGEFAERKIDEMIKMLKTRGNENLEELEKIIPLIGDEFIRINLKRMLDSLKKDKKDS